MAPRSYIDTLGGAWAATHTWHRHLTRPTTIGRYGVVYGLPVWRRPFRVITYYSSFLSCIIRRGEKGLGVEICLLFFPLLSWTAFAYYSVASIACGIITWEGRAILYNQLQRVLC